MTNKKLEDIKEILIIVDMINGFVNQGPLADPNIKKIVAENVRLVQMFMKQSNPVVVFKEAHKNDSLEFKRYPVHCLDNSYEAELIDELKVFESYLTEFKKNSTSGFMAPNFKQYIDSLKSLKEIIITGCCTDICVMDLAIPLKKYFDENNLDINIVIPENAVDTYNAPSHIRDEWNQMAFCFMKQAGIEIVKKYERRV